MAYMWQLSDRLPVSAEDGALRDRTVGNPNRRIGAASIVSAIPSAFVLALLMLLSAIVWVISAVWILIAESYPQSQGSARGG